MEPTTFTARKLTISWLLLLAATFVTYSLSEWPETRGDIGARAAFAMLIIAVLKGRWVINDFMGLSSVKFFWRWIMLGWLFVVAGLIALAYCLGTP